MADTIAQAINIPGIISSFTNIILVSFVFWQISLQKRFYFEQSRRDASQKIAESYQRLSATFMRDKELAAIFYQKYSPSYAQTRAIWGFVLDTLLHEHRFAKQGLHPMANFEQTAKGYIGFITDKDVLIDVLGPILKTGYDPDFVVFLNELINKRLQQLAHGL